MDLILLLSVSLSLIQKNSISKKIIISGLITNQAVVGLCKIAFLMQESSYLDIAIIYIILGFTISILLFFTAKACPGFLTESKSVKEES